jgi:hypothetical protein
VQTAHAAIYEVAHPYDGNTFAAPRMGAEGLGTVRHRLPATREADSEEDRLGCSGRMLRLILEQLLRASCQDTRDH